MRTLGDFLESVMTTGNNNLDFLAEFEFPSETLYMWTGYGTITHDGKDYIGGGNLVGISPYEETQEMEARGLQFTLSGVPSTLLSAAFLENYQGRKCRLYMAAVNNGDMILLAEDGDSLTTEDDNYFAVSQRVVDTYNIFTGLMNTMDIVDTGTTSTITLSAENILTLLKRTKTSRYTDQEQQAKYPNDLGLSFISKLQDANIVW